MTDNRQSRVFIAFASEGMALVGEGVPAAKVETAAAEVGFAIGPLAAIDQASLKLLDDALHRELHELEREASATTENHAKRSGVAGDDRSHPHDHPAHDHGQGHGHDHDHDHAHGPDDAHAAHDRHQHDPVQAPSPSGSQLKGHTHSHKVKSKRMPESAVYVLEKMAHGYKRLGQASGAGFYDHPGDGEPQLWSGLKTFERGARNAPSDDVKDRLAYAAALEAIRCQDSSDAAPAIPVAAMSGALPALADTALEYVDRVGRQQFIDRARELAARYGPRFEPPPSLLDEPARGEPR